jgi:hypothetical protein
MEAERRNAVLGVYRGVYRIDRGNKGFYDGSGAIGDDEFES